MPYPPGTISQACSKDCEDQFVICATDGPGYSSCRHEIDNSIAPLSNHCARFCGDTSLMASLNTGAGVCSSSCAAEFQNCVNYKSYAECNQERIAHTGPLANVCKKDCTATTAMVSMASKPAPSPPPFPPPRAAGSCSADCEAEFATCCDHGPGYTACLQEIRNSPPSSPLAPLCSSSCTLTAAMLAHNHGMCSKSCEREFNLCVTEGPGYATCLTELNANDGNSRLTAACTNDCTPTSVMTALANTGGACSSACETEFSNCVHNGPGYGTCVTELRTADPNVPLHTVCDAQCTFTATMLALEADTGALCTGGCGEEFVKHCVPYKMAASTGAMTLDQACNSCRTEIDADMSPLKDQGCLPGCANNQAMIEKCPSLPSASPPPPSA